MLEANEHDTTPIDHELAGVRGTDSDHEHDVDVAVHCEQLATLLLARASERDDVRSLEHRAEVGATRADRRSNDLHEVRTVRIDDVIMPVRFENSAMGGEVTLVGG